jgi:GNAT superfamily N-acetyltransferase
MYVPTLDNLTAATVELRVHPDHRRRGHARAFLAVLLNELASLGRPRVFFQVPSPYPTGAGPGEPLLREVGARPVLREVRRVVDLPAQPVFETREAPDGYRLVQWVDHAPDELVEDMAYLMHRMSVDVPLEEMDWEPEVWDVDRYRAKEAAAGLRQRSRFATAVVHADSGKVVGFTDIGVSSVAPETGYQWETLVLTEHRGHGLGLLLKAHNHRHVREGSPGTRWINTWNAESNTWMVAVNEALGFVPMEYWTEWQLGR